MPGTVRRIGHRRRWSPTASPTVSLARTCPRSMLAIKPLQTHFLPTVSSCLPPFAEKRVDRLGTTPPANRAVVLLVGLNAGIPDHRSGAALDRSRVSDNEPGRSTTLKGKPVGDATGSVLTAERTRSAQSRSLARRMFSGSPDSSQ